MQTLDSSEDTDLELMFAEIRRYPLLTADEEKDIDSKKWDAVFELSSVIAEVDDLRRTLADLLHNAAEVPAGGKALPKPGTTLYPAARASTLPCRRRPSSGGKVRNPNADQASQ
jgi:hypothetical protein